jgi:hypothetical protein
MRFLPAGEGGNEKTAEVITGLVRNIEQASNAKAAYVQAVDNACQAGIGWIRVNTEYSNDDSFDQDIRIRRVMDALGVKFDPTAQEPDKSDADFFLVYDDISHDKFKERFPDATLDDFPSPRTGGMVWKTEQTIRIAEYWYRKPAKKTLYLLEDGTVAEDRPEGAVVTATREVNSSEIWQCIVSGREVIRKEQKWAGKYFPFAPVLGEEIRLDGRTIRKGMVHDARDAQQAYNYMRTAAVEATSAQPKMPYMVSVTQIKGYENEWAALGSSNPPFMVYNSDPNVGGAPKREQPALPQTGLDSQAMLAAEELKAITGIHDASLGASSNETSGRAIMARQREGDTATYLYIDNLATALRRIGIILMDLIPKIYDTPRYVRVLKEDGTNEMAWVNKEEPGEPYEFGAAVMKIEHDLSIGEYDVVVSTGPSFQTRRQEAAESARQLVQAYPPLMQVAGDLMLKSLDMPYADEMAKRFERTIPPQLKDDQPPQPAPEPPPNPVDAARAMKDAAMADKIKAETDGIELQNAQLAAQMATVAQALPEIMQVLQAITQAQGGQGGQPPADGPPMGMPPMGGAPMGEAPPPMSPMQINAPDMGDGLPPTIELDAEPPAQEIAPAPPREPEPERPTPLSEAIVHMGTQIGEGLNALAQAAFADSEIVRDPETGRAAGMRKRRRKREDSE